MVSLSANSTISGLSTNSNPWAEKNTVSIADNLVLNRTGMAGNRKGFDYYVSDPTASPSSFYEFQSKLLWHQEANSSLWYSDGIGTKTQLTGTYNQPVNGAIRTVPTRGNLYLTTKQGIYKQTSYMVPPFAAGTPASLDSQITASGTGGGFCSGNTQVAYRITWLRSDTNSVAVQGAPSMRETYTVANLVSASSLTRVGTTATLTCSAHTFSNGDSITIKGATNILYNGTYIISNKTATTFDYTISGSPASPDSSTSITADKETDLTITFTVPEDIKSGDQWELWRTTQSASSAVSCGDTMSLITRQSWSSGTTVSYTDTTTDAFITQTPLYTNSNYQGISQQNNIPPLCKDIELYRDYVFYANVSWYHQIITTFIGTSNLVNGTSSITLSNDDFSETYIFDSAENIGTKHFQLYTSGTPSQNVKNTMKSLIKVINRQVGGKIYADYISEEGDAPGKIKICARAFTTNKFYLICNVSNTGADFTPTIPTSGTAIFSNNQAITNRLIYSKYQQPESVPQINYIDLGARDSSILRIISLTNALIILKDDGVYFITGDSPPFSSRELNRSMKVIGSNTVQRMNNKIFCLSNQGITAISESSSEVLSYPINNKIDEILMYSNLEVAFGVAHEADREYILFLPNTTNETICKQAYVFNYVQNGITRWTKPGKTAFVSGKTNDLYISSGLEPTILKKRNTSSKYDYSDEELSASITAVNADYTFDITFSSSIFPLIIGATIHQGTNVIKVKNFLRLSSTGYRITPNISYSNWSIASCKLRMPIKSELEFHYNPCGEAGLCKMFFDYSFIFDGTSVSNITTKVGSNEIGSIAKIPIEMNTNSGWGLNPFGLNDFGDSGGGIIPFRVNVPIPHNSGESLKIGFIHEVSTEELNCMYSSISYETTSLITSAHPQKVGS